MADLITEAQFTDRTGRTLSASQSTQVGELIADASALVVDIVNDSTTTGTWDAVTADTVPASIVPVVVAMVRRGLDNPHGFTNESQDGGYSYGGASGSGVFATRGERRTIRRTAGKLGVGALNLDSYLPRTPRERTHFGVDDLTTEVPDW